MAKKNTVSNLTTAQIIRILEDNLVAKKICNLTATGDIQKKGDSILFTGLADPTISDYDGTVDYESLEDAGVTLYVDQAKYFAFEVDDITEYESCLDLKNSQATRAAYKLGEAADRYVLGLYKQAGTRFSTGDVEITEANIISTLSKMEKLLREKNVTGQEMFMVMPPFVRMFLTLAGIKFQVNNGISGIGGVECTKELGFDLYISNQLPVLKDGKVQVLAGSYNSIVYADVVTDTEEMRLQNKFASAVRGLHLYGAKVIKPTELVTASFIEGAASSL